MRYGLVLLSMLFWTVTSAFAQVSVGVGIGLPGVNIGINLPLYPEFVQVPGYPVYYAPRLNSNYFFYDGMYWAYQGDNWYASSWYNGPWGLVAPEYVPLFVLRIPVRYYRNPPAYFGGWQRDAAPRWGEHWGNQWEQRRSGWDRWDRRSAPAPAPLPVYQRQYSGDRYPRVEQQQVLRSQNYRYQPRDTVVRQYYQEQAVQRAPATTQRERQEAPRETTRRQQDVQQQRAPQETRRQQEQRSSPPAPQQAPAQAPAQQRGPAVQEQRQQPQPGAAQREQQAPKSSQESASQGKGKGASQEPRKGQAHEKDRERGEERERGPERK